MYPQTNSHILRLLGRASMRLSGWRFVGPLPDLHKFVIVVAPHTSNWDFFAGVQAKWALGLDAHWLGKASLFVGPVGSVLRSMGGRPVNRESAEGVVGDVAATLASESQFVLALAPEGTRRPVSEWKTGFYRIAMAARVPIVPVALDWSRREVIIYPPFNPSGALDRDLEFLLLRHRANGTRARQALLNLTERYRCIGKK